MTDQPLKPLPRFVRKRNGRLEPFINRKFTESVSRAAAAAGIDDDDLIQRLATLAVENAPISDGAVRAESLYQMILDILDETGHFEIGRLFRSLRELKQAARRRLWIRPALLADGLFPDVEHINDAWRREELKDLFVTRLSVDDETASEIARAVEQRLLATGLDGFTPDLVSAVVSRELSERGVRRGQDAWRRMADSAGERFLFPGNGRTALSPLRPAGVETHLAAEFISREVMDAHRRGIIFLEGLPFGACLGQLAVDLDALANEQPVGGSPEVVASQAAGAVCALASLSLRPLKLLGLGKWLHRCQPRGALRGAMARAFLTSILAADSAHPLPAPIILRIGSARRQGDETIINALLDLSPETFSSVLEIESMFPGGRCPPPAKQALDLLNNGLTQTISYISARPVFALPAVAINLPLIAQRCDRSGSGACDEFIERVADLAELLLLAFADWRDWQNRQLVSDARIGRLLERSGTDRLMRAKRKWQAAVTPTALRYALEILFSDRNVTPDDMISTGTKTLRVLMDRLKKLGKPIDLPPFFDTGYLQTAIANFSVLEPSESLFGGLFPAHEPSIRQAYSSGPYHLRNAATTNPWFETRWNADLSVELGDGARPLNIAVAKDDSAPKNAIELADILRRHLNISAVRFIPSADERDETFIDLKTLLDIARDISNEKTLFDS